MADISWSYLGIPFICDENKRRINQSKHAVDLVKASTAFADPAEITVFDSQHSEDEDRFTMLGKNDADVLLRISFTMRGDTVRLISARKATKSEEKLYGTY